MNFEKKYTDILHSDFALGSIACHVILHHLYIVHAQFIVSHVHTYDAALNHLTILIIFLPCNLVLPFNLHALRGISFLNIYPVAFFSLYKYLSSLFIYHLINVHIATETGCPWSSSLIALIRK